MDFSVSDLNSNSVVIDNVAMLPSIENLPGFEACAAFTVNSMSVSREDVDIVAPIVDDMLSYVPWRSDNKPFAPLTYARTSSPAQIALA